MDWMEPIAKKKKTSLSFITFGYIQIPVLLMEKHQHTSDLEEASSSEFDSSESGCLFTSCTSGFILGQWPFSFGGFFSGYVEGVVEVIRGELLL